MKKLFCFIVFFSFLLFLDAQEKVSIKDTQVGINTIGESKISIRLIFDLNEGYRHRTAVFLLNNPGINFRLSSIHDLSITNDAEPDGNMIYGNSFIGFQFNVSSLFMNKVLAGNADYFIETKDTLFIELINDELKDTIRGVITPDQIRVHTRNKLVLSEEEMEELTQSMGGEINMMANNIDFGFLPGDKSNSGTTEYYIGFDHRTKYKFLKESPLFFQASGLVSTNFRDSLNHLRIYPLSYSLMNKRNEIACQAGIEGNQVFSAYRFTGDIHWQGVISNLIDLTYGINRLRLKPVIQSGLKIYQEVENNRPVGNNTNVFSGIAYAQAYYYIPVLRLYSLVIDGNVFYDFNRHANPDKELKFLYTVTMGMEIPKSGIKTICRYSYGETDISYARTSTIMIGLMADLILDTMR